MWNQLQSLWLSLVSGPVGDQKNLNSWFMCRPINSHWVKWAPSLHWIMSCIYTTRLFFNFGMVSKEVVLWLPYCWCVILWLFMLAHCCVPERHPVIFWLYILLLSLVLNIDEFVNTWHERSQTKNSVAVKVYFAWPKTVRYVKPPGFTTKADDGLFVEKTVLAGSDVGQMQCVFVCVSDTHMHHCSTVRLF